MQINTFAEARARVTEVLKRKTETEGLEGRERFAVALAPDDAGKPIDDLVTLVAKGDGAVTQEVYFDILPEVSMMDTVHDNS